MCRCGSITAAELMAQLENDKEYQENKARFDAELEERAAAWREAERPIVAALRSAGVDVDSAWDLVNTAEPYPNALPVLIEHLERGDYPDRVREGLARALAVKPAVSYWERLKSPYLAPRGPDEEDGTAVALAACATVAQLDDLIRLLSANDRQSRIFFLRPVLK